MSTVTNQIPEYRKSLENMIYQIKWAYAKSELLDCWTVGQLKNKDLYGEEILSQMSNQSTSTASSSRGARQIPEDAMNSDDEEDAQFLNDSDSESESHNEATGKRPSTTFS